MLISSTRPVSTSATLTAVTEFGELNLRGAGGEPVLLARMLGSHGVASLPPSRIDEERWTLEVTLPVARGARTMRVSPGRKGHARVEVLGPKLSERGRAQLHAQLRHMFRLDEDLSPFYAVARDDADLAWVAGGAGRMLRSPTVFEDVVKTVCTTNVAWGGTVRMVTALVDELGTSAPTGAHAFPSAAQMAEANESFYRDIARAGYRGAYLRALAASVASGELDLEELNDPELPVDEIEERLLALPGVGPYAAAHVMLTSLGRYSRLVLDSWTRPTYAKLAGRKASDKTIARRFKRYGDYAGLAFWLMLTRDWVADEAR
jgi:3-methyladenine DNA glycosylase/8-oxoguanine DNA glycosylase